MTDNAVFIKIEDPDISNELIASGFRYMLENYGDKQLTVFVATPELQAYLQSRYETIKAVRDNKLHF